MNKLFTKIVGAALGLTMAIGVGVAVSSNREAVPVHAAETITNTITFGSGSKVGSYTSSFDETDSASIGWTISKFNNNNWGWSSSVSGANKSIKVGNKTAASVGTIQNKAELSNTKFTKVDLYISARTSSYINSITVYGGSTSSSVTTQLATVSDASPSTTNPTVLTLSNQSNYKFYKIAFDMKKHSSSNGLLTLDKVCWYQNTSTPVTAINLSGTGVTGSNPNYSYNIASSSDTTQKTVTVGLTPTTATDQVVKVQHYSGTSGLLTFDSTVTCSNGSGSFHFTGKGNGGTEKFKLYGNTETSVISYLEVSIGTYYTVTFNSNGGSTTPASQSVESGQTFTFPSPGTKTHYSFLGWSSNGGSDKYATGATSPAVTAAITYTAYWQEDAKYTVTYSAGVHGTGSYAHTNQYGGTYTLLAFANVSGVSADSGYRFKNYTVGGVNKDPGDTFTLSAATTVTVNFEEKHDFTWDLSTNSYDSNPTADLVQWSSSFATMKNEKGSSGTAANNYLGGDANNRTSSRFYGGNSWVLTPAEGYTITSVTMTATSTSYATAFVGSTFTNASASADGTTVTITPVDGSSAISATIGGTCGFTSIVVSYSGGGVTQAFTVEYDGNGFTGGEEPSDSETYDNGEKATVLGEGTLVKQNTSPSFNYTFNGWNTKADGSGTPYAEDDEITMTGDVTLYAQWADPRTSVTLSASAMALVVGESDGTPTVTSSPSGHTSGYTLESDNTSVASIINNKIHAVNKGTAQITVHIDDDSSYKYTDGTFTVTVTKSMGNSGTGTVLFGSATGSVNVNSTSVSGDDDYDNTWTVTTVTSDESFTPNADYAQIGSSNKPATSIEFTTTLPSEYEITSMSAKFGGFNGTSGDVTLKVGSTTIGTGSFGQSDTTISSTSSAEGTVLTVLVENISKGVKAYNISYTFVRHVHVTNISLSQASLPLTLGGSSSQITATTTPISGYDDTICWYSSADNIASVASDGTVSPVAVGSCTIYCFADKNSNSTFDSGEVRASCSVTVSYATVTSITLSSSSSTISLGDSGATFHTSDIGVTVNPKQGADQSKFEWIVYDSDGLVEDDTYTFDGDEFWATEEADAVILRCRSTDNNSIYADFTLTITGGPIAYLVDSEVNDVTDGTTSVYADAGTISFAVLTEHFEGTMSYTWSSSNSSIISIDDDKDDSCDFYVEGVAGLARLSCRVQGSTKGDITVYVDVTVSAVTVSEVTWTAPTIDVFSGATLSASDTSSWNVKYSTNSGKSNQTPDSFNVKLGGTTISLPHTWAAADHGKTLCVEVGGVSSSTTTVAVTQSIHNVYAPLPGDETTSTLTFAEACGGSGTSNGGESWTITSDGTESTYDPTKGIHYGTSGAAVQYINLKSSDFTTGKITSVVVNASTASGVTATVAVNVGGNAFGGAAKSLSQTATEYTFEGEVDADEIEVIVTKPSSATKAIYCKSIAVTYAEDSGETENIANVAAHKAAQRAAVAFANAFNAAMDETENCTTGLDAAWATCSSAYTSFCTAAAALGETEEAYAKNLVKYATAQYSDDSGEACIERMMKTYEVMVQKHGKTAFMSDLVSLGAPQVSRLVNIIGENTNTVAIIVIISMVSVTAIGGYFFLRKRKENI